MSYGNPFIFLQFTRSLSREIEEKKGFKWIKVYNKRTARHLQARKKPKLLSYYYRCCSWCTGLTNRVRRKAPQQSKQVRVSNHNKK